MASIRIVPMRTKAQNRCYRIFLAKLRFGSPCKPAAEPRDSNATDKVRANHIVDRVLRLDAEASAQQLREVLENFAGRHRNLLEIFESRAAEMEGGLEPHAPLNKTQRGLIGAYFLK